MKPKTTLRERTSGRLAPITPNQILAALTEVAKGRATIAQAARALTGWKLGSRAKESASRRPTSILRALR